MSVLSVTLPVEICLFTNTLARLSISIDLGIGIPEAEASRIAIVHRPIALSLTALYALLDSLPDIIVQTGLTMLALQGYVGRGAFRAVKLNRRSESSVNENSPLNPSFSLPPTLTTSMD